MKANNIFKKTQLAQLVASSLVAGVTAGNAFAAAPLAGTEIKNLATVSYEDENGNTYTAQSNEAVITVAPQYRATVENDRTQTAAPGTTVYFPHTIVNTGNTPDTYDLTTDTGDKVYLDTNGNGEPDSGEQIVSSITLAPGETANLVVSHVIPSTAQSGDTTVITMTATSNSTGAIVEDIGDNADSGAGDPSGAAADSSATNTDTVTVTTGPVLVLNKEAVFDEINNKVTYTLTVKNNGGSDATAVNIIDALPRVDTDNDGILDTQLSLITGSVVTSGLLDVTDTQAALTTENDALVGWDVDGDGNIDANIIRAIDAVIAPGTTVSVSYAATYESNWAAGANIDNTFVAFVDPDGNNKPGDPANPNDPDNPINPPSSNTTHNEVPQNYSVNAEDNGGDDNPDGDVTTTNDGGDDDATPNDIQKVDEIASGDTVIFTHTVKNEGNGDDAFNLKMTDPVSDTFPPGTVFTFWNADGSVQLTDSDGDGIPDTGVLGQNETTTIVVKADLPSGVAGEPTNGYNAILTATSSGDNNIADTTNLQLGNITPPAVDLAASVSSGDGNQPDTGLNDQGVENAHDEGPILLEQADVGSTVVFPMRVANESGSPDSFLLSADKLPSGWTVVFKDASGGTITSTPFMPANTVFEYTAEVTIANDPAKALADAALDTARPNTDGDGKDTVNDGNSVMDAISTDNDDDYVIDFTVTSSVDAGRNDTVSNAIDVNPLKAIAITPDGQNQIQPGGTVDYPHKLVNEGNITEPVEIAVTNPDLDWSTSTLIDTDGDGTPETELSTLTPGTIIQVLDKDGNLSPLTLTDVDGDGKVEFPLQPGESVKVVNKVFAPADAAQGEVNSVSLSATDPNVANDPDLNGAVRSTATDTSNVILGQVRLDKTVALDANCDMSADGPFAAIQTAQVEPGQCAVWQIVAKNEGDALVKNVIVTDSVPAFTDFMTGSLKYCLNNGCDITLANAIKTDGVGDDAAEKSTTSDLISFYLGNGSIPANKKGGDLLPGQSAILQFTVKVNE